MRIKISGAGLSGLSAAITLAKAGLKVDVYEKNNDVGKRFHGDLEGLENWSEKVDILDELHKMNIQINFECEPFSTLTVTNGSNLKKIKFKTPLFYLVKRGSFPGSLDYGLKEQAHKAGVAIHFGTTIPQEQADIVATGPTSHEVAGIDKGIAFKTTMKDTAVLLLNEKAAYKGYAYLLVTKGYGCMCTVVLETLTYIARCFEETKKIFSAMMDLDIQEPKEVGGIGSFSTKNVFKKGKSLFVGEAAGLQDFLWGFGMRYAFTSGFLAAQSIINGEDYEHVARTYFSHKLKASITNRYLWEKCGEQRYSLILKNGRMMRRILYSIHKYNFIQKMVYPIAVSYVKKRYGSLRV